MSAPIATPSLTPDWYVTDGAKVVGPVDTPLLLKGVSFGRVPEGCLIAQPRWNLWRPMDTIREIRALRQLEETGTGGIDPWNRVGAPEEPIDEETDFFLDAARDPGELVHFAMNRIAARTSADVALAHRMRAPYLGLVTSCVKGTHLLPALGTVLPERDPARVVGDLGTVVFGKPWSSPARAAVADRLSPGSKKLRGVAMVPLRCAGRLYAIIEIGRRDHAFRATDRTAVRAVASAAVSRLEIVSRSC